MTPTHWLEVLEFVVRTSAVALLAGGLLAVLRLRRGAVLHAAWTAVLFFTIAWPALRVWAPSVEIPIGDLALVVPAITTVTASVVGTTALDWPIVIAAAYVSVALALVLRMVAGAVGARGVRRESRLVPRLGVRESAAVDVPCAIGLLRPEIILPLAWRSWGPSKLAGVLAHERAHVSRCDPLTIVTARVARAVLWAHPLSWWLERRITSTAEYAADDTAVQVVGAAEYAGVLLDVAASARRARRLAWGGVAMAGSSRLGARIDRIIEGESMRRISWKRVSVFATSLVGVFVAALVFASMPTSAATVAMAQGLLPASVVVEATWPTGGSRGTAGPTSAPVAEAGARPVGEAQHPEAAAPVSPVSVAAAPAGPAPVGGSQRQAQLPKVIYKIDAQYTPAAMRAKVQGDAVVEVLVREDGRVGDAQIVVSLDPQYGLDEEALTAARRWRFEPATDETGTAIATRVRLVMEFRLR